MKILIGKSTLMFNQEGVINYALFNPNTMLVRKDEDLEALTNIVADKDEDVIIKQAEMVMAKWFSKVENVELADREKFKIVSEMDECHKYPAGNPSKVSISFYFVDIPEKVIPSLQN